MGSKRDLYVISADTGYRTPCFVDIAHRPRPDGYAVHFHDGKVRRTHRVLWERANGPIPEGMVLDHLCRFPRCVREDHLEAVPQRVNIYRGKVAILTIEQAREIRSSEESTDDLALQYGVHPTTVRDIRKGRKWTWV